MPEKEGPIVLGKKKMTPQEREEILIENFVSLQHAMTNMSIKFNFLAENISKLLQIFEETARNLPVPANKIEDSVIKDDMIKKIDSLLDQNKTIAQGLVIMEEKLRKPEPPVIHISNPNEKPKPKPLPNL